MKSIITCLTFVLLWMNSNAQLRTQTLEIEKITVGGVDRTKTLEDVRITYAWSRGEKGMMLSEFLNSKPTAYGKLELVDAIERKKTELKHGGFTFKLIWYSVKERDGTKQTVPAVLDIVDTPDGEKFTLSLKYDELIRYSGTLTRL